VSELLNVISAILRWLLNRPVLTVRISQDDPQLDVGNLVFEVENASGTVTSLKPVVRSTFYYPKQGRYQKGRATYDVRELDRGLPPYQPRILSATARALPAGCGFSWFLVYRFKPRRGPSRRVRVRNMLLEPVPPIRFWLELIRFHLTGKVKKYGSMTIETMKRSQGPH